MINTQIYIEGKGYLQLAEGFAVPLTYNVADVKDLANKKSGFSKTLTLPANKSNNVILGQLFEINTTNSSFNIHRKVKCKVLSNGVPVMDGYFKLESIEKSSQTSIGGDQLMFYKATVFDQTTNFFDTLGDRLIEDLDLSQYNHIFSGSAILASSASTASDVYTYPMLYNTNTTNYTTKDFFPSIYLKALVDAIFNEAQYSYQSDFINGVSEDGLFTHLIVPFNGEHRPNNQAVIDDRKLYVGMTGATSTRTFSGANEFFLGYNADNNGVFYDTPNDWANSGLTSSSNQLTDFRVRVPLVLSYHSISGASLVNTSFSSSVSVNDAPYFKPRLIVKKNGATINSTYVVSSKVSLPTTISAGTTTLTGIYVDVTVPAVDLVIGDQLKFYINPSVGSSAFHAYKTGSTVITPTLMTTVQDINTTGGTNSLLNIPRQTDITDGDTIYLNEFLPKNIKQKDFIKWIVQMFNLYIEQDKDFENKLVIKTRDEYFDNNKVVDWTHKFSLDRPSEIKFIPELQARDLYLNYKQANDAFSKIYSEQYKQVYGYQKFTFDNDYLQGEQKIEVGFESTPLVENGFGLIVPAISSEAPKCGLKLMYKPDQWVAGNWNFKYQKNGVQTIVSLSGYPYAGHYDRPVLPTLSLSFGEEDQLFYWQYGKVTDNTIGNRFYSNYIDQLLDGKMLTGYFDLNEVDIAQLDFSRRVWLKDATYYINKIIDYDPTSNNLTKVELIKVDAPLKFKTRNNFLGGTIRPVRDIAPADIISLPANPFNPVKPTYGLVTNNIVKSKNAIVIGENNFVDVNTKGLVLGDNNTTSNNKSLIIGDNNTAEAEGSIVFGDNITATTPNTVFVSNLTIASGGTLDLSGVVLSGASFSASTPALSEVLAVGNDATSDIKMSSGFGVTSEDGSTRLTLETMLGVLGYDDFAGNNALVGISPASAALALNTTSTNNSIEFNTGSTRILTTGSGYEYEVFIDSNGIAFKENIGGDIPLLIDTHGVTIGSQYTLPNVDGSVGQVLATDGAGTISWTSISGSTSSSGITSLNGLSTSAQTFATSASGTDFTISSAGSTHTFILPVASATNTGKLRNSDWVLFNGKASTATTISTTAPLQGGGNLSANRTFSITQATSVSDGYLSSSDWNLFNSKIDASDFDTTLTLNKNGSIPNLVLKSDITSSNDPYLRTIAPSNTHSYAIGSDTSDSNKFKISYAASTGATLGTNDRLTIDTSGNISTSGDLTIGGVKIGGYVTAVTLSAAVANTSNTVYTTFASFSAAANVTYKVNFIGTYQTAATTTGVKIKLSGTATCNVVGVLNGAISNAAVATALAFPTTSMTSELVTTGVAAINTPHYVGGEMIFRCTVAGTVLFTMASEVNASSAQLNIGSSVIVERIN